MVLAEPMPGDSVSRLIASLDHSSGKPARVLRAAWSWAGCERIALEMIGRWPMGRAQVLVGQSIFGGACWTSGLGWRSNDRGGLEGSIVLGGENLGDLFWMAKEFDGDRLAPEKDASQPFPFHRPLGQVPDQHMANLVGELGSEFGVDFWISFAAVSDQHELSLGHPIDHSRDDAAFAFAS